MEVTYLGHAAILVRSGGTSLLMDPWLEDPAYCNSWFHYPPLELRIEDVAPVDYVWCSHDHPDHFDRKTLAKLPRDQKILVPQFASGRLGRQLRAEGFTDLVPMPFDREMELGPDLRVTGMRTDLVWEDSALVVEGGGVRLFNMNDCKLGDDLLRAIGERYPLDIAFVPFSGAIQFPTCYGYDAAALEEMCAERRQRHLRWFVHRIELLGAKRAVPFAGNFALLHRDQVWMNEPESNNINTPDEAIAALAEGLPHVEGVQMNPGDRWTVAGGLELHKPAPAFADKMREVRALARKVADDVDALRSSEPPARSTLRADLEGYFAGVARRHPELPGRIDARVVIEAEGKHGGVWCLVFDREGFRCEDFNDGDAWNLRMTMSSSLLQQAVDGAISWDELALSFRVRFAENPEFFNQDFWVMLYNNEMEFLAAYLRDPAPKF